MRVLYVNHTSVISGAERTLLDLLGALPEEVVGTVACPPGELADAVHWLGIAWVPIAGTSGSLRLHPRHSTLALIAIARSAARLCAHARASRADLVHANSVRAGLIATAARALGGPPVVCHLHDVLPAGRAGSVLARLLARSSVVVLANSDYTAAGFRRKANDRGRLEVVDNPVDLDRFDPASIDRATSRDRLGLPPQAPLVGVIAQLTPWKAQSDAIRALAVAHEQHPELRLVVAGAAKFVGPGTRYDNETYERSLHELSRRLDVTDSVIFTGELDEVPILIAALDLVLLPSWEEPFGRVVIEAMAMKTPVIATNVGGPAGIVTDGVDGALLPPREPDLWGARIAELLDSPKRMAAMGSAARTSVIARYDLPSFTRRIVDIYGWALESRAATSRSMSWPGLLRRHGRWLMRGPRRRRLYETLNRAGRRLLGSRVRSGPAAGLRFRGGDTIGYVLGLSEPALQRALSGHLRSGGVLYDVGAHAGFVSVLGCHLVGPTGHVHCFEPVPDNIATLRSNLEANSFRNATIHELALSDADGEIRMDLGHRGITAHFSHDGTFVASATRCDSLGLEPPSVVKIDVEGAESRVLEGMRRTLSEERPVVLVEIHEGQDAPVRNILRELAYDVTELEDNGGMPHLLALPRQVSTR
jgi:FkbM family methyltransferase